MQYNKFLDRNLAASEFSEVGRCISLETAFSQQAEKFIVQHGADRYVSDSALAEIREKAQKKFLELKPLIRKNQPNE